MLIKVVLVQARLGRPLSMAEKIGIFKQRPDFVCLPEYWLLDESVTDYQRAALLCQDHMAQLSRLSEELSTCLIGGTVVAAANNCLYNSCPVIDRGELLGHYRKRNPAEGERAKGISPGDDPMVLDIRGLRVGVMVCADVFQPEQYDDMAEAGADLIVIPTVSPFLVDDTPAAKRERDKKYFTDGARRAGAYVAKVCGVGSLFGKPLQGRSLVSSPWEIMVGIDFENEDKVRLMTVTLDIDELRDFRTKSQRRLAKEA